MADKAWKAFERRVAADWNTVRNSLSGSNSKMTASDSLHDRIFLEGKLNAESPFWRLYLKAKPLADKEGKAVVLCLGKKHQKGYVVAFHVDDFRIVIEEYLRAAGLKALAKEVRTALKKP